MIYLASVCACKAGCECLWTRVGKIGRVYMGKTDRERIGLVGGFANTCRSNGWV